MEEGEGHGMALKVLPAFLPYPSRRLRPRLLLSGAYKTRGMEPRLIVRPSIPVVDVRCIRSHVYLR